MTSSTGVSLDPEALRRAAEVLRASEPALGKALIAVTRAVGEAGPAAGAPALAAALEDLLRRWDEGVAGVAARVDLYGVLLREAVDAHVADDAAGASSLTPPPR